MACTQHIAANVETKFGKTPAKQVMSIGRTFSTRQEDYLFDIVKKASTGAEQYLRNIDGKLWRSTYFNKFNDLPPRYGIITSNSVECTNSWILEERSDLPWLGIVESITEK